MPPLHPRREALKLLSLALLLAVPGVVQAYSPNPDLAASGSIATLKADPDASPRYEYTYNLGPTGLRGWIYIDRSNKGQQGLMTDLSRQILVTHVGAGTPAVGVLAVDDVILGVGWGSGAAPVPHFAGDCRKSFGWAIGEAEKAENGGILKLKRWRAGVTTDVEITLPVMGTYTDDAPYGNCPKSALILSNAVAVLAGESYGGGWKGSVSALALLSTGDPAHLPGLETLARSLSDGSSGLQMGRALGTWNTGYEAVFLAEYYLATGDAQVVPGIHNYSLALSRSQSMYGTFGHGGAMLRSDGGFNGSIPWYGPVNSAGLVANLGIVLGKKAIVASGGVVDPEIDPAIARAANFFGSYVNKGGIPYGEHEPAVSHADNGKSGMTSMMFTLMGDKPVQAEFFARMCISTHVGEEYGHTGQGFSYLWTALGANAGGADAGAAFLKEVRWHRDLARRSDGSFAYDGAEQYGGSSVSDYWDASSYYGLSPTAIYVLQLALPRKQLCITGRDADPAEALSTAEVDNAIWAGKFSQEANGYTTQQLLDALGEYDPVVRKAAAGELGARTGEHATLRPQLIVMAEDMTDANKRQGACEALGYMGTTDALPALGRRLSDPDLWVRGRAAEALGRLGSTALPELTTMLTAFVANATDPHAIVWDDPLQLANGYLSKVLFSTEPFRTEIRNEDTALFHAAVRAGLQQPDGRARGHLSSLIKQDLDWADVQAVAPNLVEAVAERSPADQMFSDGIRYAGLETLAKYKVEEGIPLCLLVKEQAWHSDQWKPFELLRDTYGTAASEVLPTLYDWQNHLPAFDADGSISETRYQNLEAYLTSTIAALEAGAPAPALNDFKTVGIVSTTPLDVNRVQFDATATDLDGGVPRYIWSRVSGPGSVSFSPNGTTGSATTVATFDTPGSYVVRVAVADSSILNSGIWNNSALGYVDFGTYAHDYGLVSAEQGVVVDPGTNWPPVGYSQEVVTGIDAARALTLLGFDYDGDALSYAIVTPPANGSLSGTAPDLTYTPAPGYAGGDTFTFEVTDPGGLSSTATVSIEVRNLLEVHVNMYNSAGTPSPGNPAALAGPAGGLGETWNQFHTTSGSGLLDSTGAATGVGFTNNVGSGWLWGNPALAVLHGGRAHFGKGSDTTHTITGLTPLRRYDVWIASYAHNSALGERALGEWSTPNPTTTVGPQLIDSRATGLNGATWEAGVNYVLFESVAADSSGDITLLGDAADIGDYGATYETRLPLSGFQLVELPPVPPAAPGGLAAAPGDSRVQLNWDAVPGATGYLVKRASTPGGPYTTRANPATTHFLDAPATNGTTWYYVISAVDAHGAGSDSAEVSATPAGLVPPAAPSGLTTTAGDAVVDLGWDASTTATSYIVKRGTQPGGPHATVANPSTTSYQDAAVLNGMTWYYVVSAVNSAGEGADSEEVSAQPRAVTMVVNVNLDSGSRAGLVGPAGGLGETWNQLATSSGSSLLDSGGAVTGIGYTSTGTNWGGPDAWGSPSFEMIASGLRNFDTSPTNSQQFVINGLAPGNLYDVWIASANTSSQRSGGEWSTANPTDSASAQACANIDNIIGDSWVAGNNYLLFENVEADTNGEVVFDGFSYDKNVVGYDPRLPLSGFQIREFDSDPPAPFRAWAADPAQGLTLGVNDGPGDDPEGDGLSNLLEFVLGGHPMTHTSGVLPTVGPDAGGGWVFEYQRSNLSAPPATTQVVEYGTDLEHWTEVPIPLTSAGTVTITPGSPSDHVSVAIPDLGATGFARLKITE